MEIILKDLKDLRNKSYEFNGSYEDNYTFFMNKLDDLIADMEMV